MKIRCPHCKVIYNIKSTTLADADYKVVCSECHKVFEVKSKDTQQQTNLDDNPQGLQSDAEMQDLLAELQHSMDKQDAKQSDQPPTGSHQAAEHRDEQRQEQDILSSADRLFAEEPDRDDFLADKPEAEELLPGLSQQKKPISLLAVFSLLALLLTALAQISWINKEQLLQLPQVHAAATRLCSYFDCSLPQEQAAEQHFIVVDRTLQPSGKQPRAYRLEVLLRNAGASTSPLPALQLSLLDDKQATIARRTFPASAYTKDTGHHPEPLAAGELLEIQLLILPPEAHFSGFELDFIPVESS
ncbi:zinc-ribbon and DUF3426 domain-containing protein [Thiolapillus sp.]